MFVSKGNISEEHKNVKGYVQFEYVKEELPHLMKAASIVVSRAGANFIFELLALKNLILLHTSFSKSKQRRPNIKC